MKRWSDGLMPDEMKLKLRTEVDESHTRIIAFLETAISLEKIGVTEKPSLGPSAEKSGFRTGPMTTDRGRGSGAEETTRAEYGSESG
jgi:hypothetical protein